MRDTSRPRTNSMTSRQGHQRQSSPVPVFESALHEMDWREGPQQSDDEAYSPRMRSRHRIAFRRNTPLRRSERSWEPVPYNSIQTNEIYPSPHIPEDFSSYIGAPLLHSTVPCPPGLEMDSHPIGPSEMEEGSVTFSPPRSTSSQTGEFESGTWNDDPMDWLLPNRGRIVERQRWSIHSRLQRCIEISMLLRNTSDALKNDTDRNLSAPLPMPAYTSLLSPGLEFKGVQRCLRTASGISNSIDDWVVHAQIKRYDRSNGFLCGTMSAFVKNNAPVETFWIGEIIDNQNHTFHTNKWSADTQTDLNYWTKFPAFRELKHHEWTHNWKTSALKEYPYLFMRWKETYFIKKTEQNLLTIQGFYYICMNRQTGALTGYYCDPDCQPFQELELTPNRRGRSGMVFSYGEFI